MKIKELSIKNFGKFQKFTCEFNDKVTSFIGVNGSGKTSILTAIWTCIKGMAEKNTNGNYIGERFRFIGSSGKSADLQLVIHDESKGVDIIAKNHITDKGNQISFSAPEGYIIDSDFSSRLFNSIFLSAKNFCQLSGKDQAIALGIDVSKFDKETESLKKEYTEINRDVTQNSNIPFIEKCEPVSISELIKEKSIIDLKNESIKNKKREIENYKNSIAGLQSFVDSINAQIAELEKTKSEKINKINELEKYICENTVQEQEISTLEIVMKIADAEEINKKAAMYEQYKKAQDKYREAVVKLQENKDKQAKVQQQKIDYIKSFNFGFDGLDVDDYGNLQLKGRPIKEQYFSKGELEIIVSKLYIATNPELKIRFIDDFECLDVINQEKLVNTLTEQGFQIITAEVGHKSKGSNTLLLRNCEIVESYEECKENLI